MKTPSLNRRAGFSLVEMLISVTIAAILATSATMVAAESYVAFKTANVNSSLEGNLRRSMDRVVRELMSTGIDSIFPAVNADPQDDVVFSEIIDVTEGVVTWGNPKRLAFEYEAGELDDGVDNNGNGLVDEGILVFVLNDGQPNERRVVLCHGVSELLEGEEENGDDDNGNDLDDEPGFCVLQEGNVLTIRLTLEQASDQVDRIQRTLITSIRLRN